MPKIRQCDFCSVPEVCWSYPALDFVDQSVVTPTQIIISQSVGAWAACDECHRLIEADDREALLERSVGKFVEFYGVLPPALAEDIRRLHDQFFAHRCGPVVPVLSPVPSQR